MLAGGSLQSALHQVLSRSFDPSEHMLAVRRDPTYLGSTISESSTHKKLNGNDESCIDDATWHILGNVE